MNESPNILIQKLDEFIRKYYKNQLVKGVLYSLGLVFTGYVTIVLLEYFLEFSTGIRTGLFYGFVAALLFILTRYIIIPLLKLYKFGHVINYEDAAKIIGSHFTAIQDKLLNVLQLQSQRAFVGSEELLVAGINQKIIDLKPVPFTAAINISENKQYLKYVLPPLVITLSLLLIWPHIITTSTNRLVNYQTAFEKQAPFTFSIQNKSLEAVQQQDYVLELKINGNEIPNDVFITVNGNEFPLEKMNTTTFQYVFKNVQKTLPFHFNAAGFTSKDYELNVLPKPMFMNFDVVLQYPAYLHKNDEKLVNTGDMIVPQGTKVKWLFTTKNTDNVFIRFADSLAAITKQGDDQYTYSKKVMASANYSLKALNQHIHTPDSINYSINVIPDQYPSIDVSERKDSLNPKNIYFSGITKDDYGFNRLVFHYKFYSQDSTNSEKTNEGELPITINKAQLTQSYFHFFDLSRFNIHPGDKVEYYFEVWDNDGVNGSKAAKTQIMTFKAPTLDELKENTDKNNTEIKNDLDQSINKAKQLQKDLNEMSRKMAEKKQLGWEEKKKLEDIINKQKELEKKIEESKQQNQLNNQQQQEFTPVDEALLEKQKQLEQLFQNIMTPEMKKLFDELNKLLEKMDKNQVQQKVEELKLTNKDLEKELDRTLEAFKQLEVEQKMQQVADKLDDLAKKEDNLSKEAETKNADANDLKQKQDDLNKQFDDLKKDVDDLNQKNNELERPNDMPKTEQLEKEISKEQQNSSDQLKQNNKKNASKSQKQAANKMQEMKNAMQSALESMQQEQQEEDMQTLRQILENLLNLSFAQEDLIKKTTKTRTDNPQYTQLPKQQKKLQDDSKIIEDSLLALSKRVPQISATVNREISAITMNMEKAIDGLAERMTSDAQQRMQYSMTSINNLALMLNESLEQMQAQAQQSGKPGSGNCKKPGSGQGSKPSPKPSMATMRQMQQQLNQQLQQLKEALEKGQKPGEKPGQGKKPGEKPGGSMGMGANGTSGMSEQLAKMAAQQEAIRQQMQKMMDQMKKNGGSNPGGDLTNLMEETEKDIVNKAITQETMNRQQQIITRLLESEKAEREREQDEQRKSNEAKNQNFGNPSQFLEYKRMKEREMELLKTVPPSLTPYYKGKVNNYFNSVTK